MSGRDTFNNNKCLINLAIKVVSLIPRRLRMRLIVCCRNIRGRKGIAIRYLLLKTCAKQCGENVSIKEMVVLENVQNLVLGNNISIHPFCYIEAIGGVNISDDVSIAHSSSILSANHTWDNTAIPIKYNPIETSPVNIEKDVWVGCGCRILAGVTIHSHSVVAAGAVVSKNVESGVVVGGVPAKKIKTI